MSKRAILLIMGVVVAYFAIYFGDGVYMLAVAGKTKPMDFYRLSILSSVIFVVAGAIGWAVAMMAIPKLSSWNSPSSEVVAYSAAVGLIFFSCAFGIMAGPFTNYGPYPWHWASRWDVLPILALVPMILAAHDLISDAITAWRNRKTKKNSVLSIHRGSA